MSGVRDFNTDYVGHRGHLQASPASEGKKPAATPIVFFAGVKLALLVLAAAISPIVLLILWLR